MFEFIYFFVVAFGVGISYYFSRKGGYDEGSQYNSNFVFQNKHPSNGNENLSYANVVSRTQSTFKYPENYQTATHNNSSRNTIKNHTNKRPYQDFSEKCYGYFKCTNCYATWQSAHTWRKPRTRKGSIPQDCKKCGEAVSAYKTEEFTCQLCFELKIDCQCEKMGVVDNLKPHLQSLCHKCKNSDVPCSSRGRYYYQ